MLQLTLHMKSNIIYQNPEKVKRRWTIRRRKLLSNWWLKYLKNNWRIRLRNGSSTHDSRRTNNSKSQRHEQSLVNPLLFLVHIFSPSEDTPQFSKHIKRWGGAYLQAVILNWDNSQSEAFEVKWGCLSTPVKTSVQGSSLSQALAKW
jgi:hypothetical protein